MLSRTIGVRQLIVYFSMLKFIIFDNPQPALQCLTFEERWASLLAKFSVDSPVAVSTQDLLPFNKPDPYVYSCFSHTMPREASLRRVCMSHFGSQR